MPCIKTPQTAAKIIAKGQQTLENGHHDGNEYGSNGSQCEPGGQAVEGVGQRTKTVYFVSFTRQGAVGRRNEPASGVESVGAVATPGLVA